MVTTKIIKTQACPECNKRNGYFKVDGTFRCRSCNFNGWVKENKSKGEQHAISRMDEGN